LKSLFKGDLIVQRALAPLLLAVLFPSSLHAAKIPISGRAVDSGGKAVAAAKVLLIPIPTVAESGKLELAGKADPEPAVSATTDASGGFQIAAPDAGMWKVRIEARGMVPLETLLQPLVDEVDLPDAKLSPDSGFKVTVTDPAGKPAAGARVRIADARRSTSLVAWSIPVRLAATGADGSATLPRATDENLTVKVGTAKNPVIERKSVHGATASFHLAAGQTRHLVVRDAQSKGVAGVVVSQDGWTFGRTSESGALDLALPDANGAGLRLAAEDGRSLEYRLRKLATAVPPAPPTAGTPDVATLPAAPPLAGRVVSARDGHPLAGALAWLSGDTGAAVRTGADGSFRLTAPPESTVSVEAAAPGFFAAFAEAGGSRRSPSLALKPRLAAQLGVVVDEAGHGLPGAALTATPVPGTRMSISTFDLSIYRSGGLVHSGAGGRFRLASLLAGVPYSLRIELPGFAPSRADLPLREDGQAAPELRVVLRVGQEAFGMVLDADHRAVAGARASLRPASGSDPMARLLEASRGSAANLFDGTSDAKGRFAVAHLPAGTWELTVKAAGFAPLTVPGLAVPEGKGATDLGTVVLSPGAAVEGQVVDPDGKPIEGAEIRALTHGAIGNMFVISRDPGAADAFTAADGAFRLEDRAPGQALDLTVSHPGYGQGKAQGVAVPSAEPVRIVLQPTARVSGRVLGKDGKGIAGARVTLSEMVTMNMGGRSMMRPGNWKPGVTDEDGAFSYSDVSPGNVEVRAEAPRHQAAELKGLEAKPGQELTGVELLLPAAAIVEGRVVSPDGQPVPGAEVTVTKTDSAQGIGFSDIITQTDGDGRYILDGVPPGPRTLEARAEGYRRAVRDLEVKEGDTTADFTLESGFQVSGRVIDEAGNPVVSAQLLMMAGRSFTGVLSALSGPDGTFHFDGVQPGTFRLTARKTGYAANPLGDTVTVSNASVSGLEVKLAAGGSLTGRITGADFSQLARILVLANGARPGQVDADGIYRIANVPPGDYVVSASVPDTALHAEGRVTLEPGAAEAKLDLQFGKGFTLSGVVLRNGSPLPGAGVELTRTGTFSSHDTSADHQGAFQFGGLDAGTYELAVRTAGGALHKESVEISGDREVRVDLRTASLGGRVTDAADSTPVAGAQVTLEAADGKDTFSQSRTETDSHGAFRLAEVADGAWKLRVSHDGYSPADKNVQVDGADSSDLEISLSPTEGLTLAVVLPSGEAPESIRAGVLDNAGKTVAAGFYPVGENGRVRLSNVPPGSWQIFVDSDFAAPGSVAATVPGPVARIALAPAGVVRVKVPALTQDDTTAKVSLAGPGGAYRAFDYSGQVVSQFDLYHGTQSFSRIPAGTWQVTAKAADGRTFTGTTAVTPGGVVDVTLK
jgi:uncharacterized GH25 family protein